GYAGYKNEGYIQSTYRSQWTNFPGAPKTLSVTADFSANEGTMGFGLSFVDDRIGPTVNSGGLLTYAYRMRTGVKSHLSLGVSGGFSKYGIDPSLLSANDPNDPLIPEGRVNVAVPNLNSGVFFHTDKFYAGISVYNMIGKGAAKREDVGLAYHDFHYYLTAGALFKVSSEVQFKPSFLVKQTKGSPTNYDLNAMFLFKEKLWVGGSFRSNTRAFENFLQEDLVRRNAVAAIVEFFATPDLRIGYAYDHNLNVLNSYRNNSHEFSLGYYLRAKNTVMKNPRWF
ncbi:MAG: type IX secretion system membrane protein PorP/SprF, partial [Algoriphagus sp.]|nr:type IX secretion system membrane protein PorP/SprF [Algoriphagus sp.]